MSCTLAVRTSNITIQEHLKKALTSIFPAHEILINSRKSANIVSIETGRWLELDVWIPSLKLAFEFQDPHHYVSREHNSTPLNLVKRNDKLKKDWLIKRGETLVVVPCWWDGSTGSLIETIRVHRPDLVASITTHMNPINNTPSSDLFNVGVPEVGELMVAIFSDMPDLQNNYWWISEKYDGTRACWVPSKSHLFSRYGKEIAIYSSIRFPEEFLDGELWFGRGTFRESQKLYSHADVQISYLRYIAFDDINSKMRNCSFESRYQALCSQIDHGDPFVIFAGAFLSSTKDKLIQTTHNLLMDGAEGIILRKKDSLYTGGNSSDFLKFKAKRKDEEALIADIGINNVTLQLPTGELFTTSNWECEEGPKIGEVVTFSYSGYSTRGVPVDPKVIKKRVDISWSHLLEDSYKKKLILNDSSSKAFQELKSRKMQGHWRVNEGENVRNFLDSLLQSRSKDPLNPEHWYEVTLEDIISLEGGVSILSSYNGSLVRALKEVYPNIGLDDQKMSNLARKVWNMDSRRTIFDLYAMRKGFDPLQAQDWSHLIRNPFSIPENIRNITKFRYGGSILRALKDVYPEVEFNKHPNFNPLRKVWNRHTIRKFFDGYAAKHNFDPLQTSHWYSISSKRILVEEGGHSVLDHYGGSYIKALMDVYPSCHFDAFNFASKPKNFWKILENRRHFFDNYANKKGFDPNNSSAWSSVDIKELQEHGGHSILNLYSGSLLKALDDVYRN